jgi:two-component system CheB/CheR fusion protein
LRAQTAHDFAHYKRATVLRRIARRMQVNSIESIPRYLVFLRKHSAEAQALLQDLLIGVTHFFRDREAFAALESHIPQLFAGKRRDEQVRVWVAGCATGEEAYSVAMLLCEHAERVENAPKIQVFASDIDQLAIHDARDALYPATIEADISIERLRQFFVRDHGHYRVRKELRELVLFAAHDVLKDAPFSRVDLVSCRNLLIYLNEKAQEQMFDIFHFALRAGGMLFIGGAEGGQAATTLFSPLDGKHRLYVRRSVPRPIWKVPTLPLRTPDPNQRISSEPRPRRLLSLTATKAESAAGQETQTSRLDRQERRAVLFGELHLRLLEEYGPPSAVVNEAHDLVHLSEKAGCYLQFVAGEPSANIVALVRPELRGELRTALFRAGQTGEISKASPTRVDVDGQHEAVELEVRPMRAKDVAHGYFLILFTKVDPAGAHPPPVTDHGPGTSLTTELENEIQFLKQQLNSTVEQYEATAEELKASNEELQAMNEEMRSATEELETSKEELQSVNEELITVNIELKSSVEDLSRSNTDLTNLMASTDIGTIFLDRQLRIARFTPSAQRLFNLIPSDLGRPLSDITHRLSYPNFITDAEAVLRELKTAEHEVRVGEAKWFMTRIAPYRTADDRIAGVVATFIDITARKHMEEELRHSREELERQSRLFDATLSTITDFAYLLDREGRFLFANKPLLDLWGLKLEEAVGKNFYELKYEPQLAARLHEQIEHVFKTGELVTDETPYINPEGKEGFYEYIFSPLRGSNGEVQSVVGSTHVITERKLAELALRESEDRMRKLADAIPQLVWTNNTEGTANYFNRRWYEYTGLSYDESRGPGWEAVIHPEDAGASKQRWQHAFEKGEVFDAEFRLRRHNGEYRWFIARNVPMLDTDGRVVSWFGSATDIHDLKEAEAAQRESEERFRLLVQGAKDYAMFLLNLDNHITYWSNGAERVFGWSAEEAVGQTGDLIFVAEDKAKGAVQREIEIALNEGRAPDRRWHLRKDEGRFWVDGVMMRLDDPNGEPRGFAKIARDATEQRRAEEELRHARDQLEQRVLERTADLMATNNELERTMHQRELLERELLEISERERRRIGQDLHDVVCQELTATALFLKSASKTAVDPTAGKTLDEAAEIVNRNVAIARDLARGFQPTVLASGGLAAALRSLCKEASGRPGIHCTLKMPRAVRMRDETIALNLFRIAQEAMRNAISHSGGDEIIICVERERELIRLVVEDNGKGYRPRKRSKGLGVHIMEYRTNVLGGRFGIVPRPKGGARVVCEVPIKK